MNPVALLGLASSLSFLAGWRMYLTLLGAGLAMRYGLIAPPAHMGLAFLASWWVIGASAVGAAAEFFADKIAWVDSAWDAVHTFIRPLGGALIAAAVVDARDPGWQMAALLLGGGAALMSHTAKASTRALVQASPEPFSNMAVSAGEDVGSAGLLGLALASPLAAGGVALLLFAVSAALIWSAWRTFHRVRLWVRARRGRVA